MALTPEKVGQMKVDELKVELRKRRLQVSGTKRQLLGRLNDDDARAVKRAFITNDDGAQWDKSGMLGGPRGFLAAGEFRYVYKQRYQVGPRAGQWAVEKVFKTGAVWEAKFFQDDIYAVHKAGELIARFMQEIWAMTSVEIKLNKCEIWHDLHPDALGRRAQCLVEPFIEGAYIKFNSNTGYADESHAILQALSHFTYHFTGGEFLVCDLQGGKQGDRYTLTDPVVLSKDRRFGATDLVQRGIGNFFAHHKCGVWCQPHWAKPSADVTVKHFRAVMGTTFM
mmetsp:Transcript_35198/g.101176  ORF Transcript_35198/g.101176 Transcript_35198/m.101176 type:complete len:281 (-) Transcript_35198:60-902(-)|eukprot:CAMPEP_0177162284 /NCGR_PEP_ID=MMETSP0367-20130122/5805_1 /TAXON_ID=447022 ORGANISM="Scrippsiella hangoei-like, Strain SHHI-4" /NCGR_SAMPLE_ID=MMETSP0367 /ASSEMBLY_ACC=CAM_ASM_000362 /LENGTH=280 /DNA_ID=CAMNT_0018608049 /DNA_START=74 /DNA_END=916 /DNA_ORIENTATION=+